MTTSIAIKRAVRLPNGRLVSLGRYVSAWRQLRDMPDSASVAGFDHFPTDAASILREMRYGMHDRINRHIPWHGQGRKWHPDWQRSAGHMARAVNTPRLIVRPPEIPYEFRERMAHRLTED